MDVIDDHDNMRSCAASFELLSKELQKEHLLQQDCYFVFIQPSIHVMIIVMCSLAQPGRLGRRSTSAQLSPPIYETFCFINSSEKWIFGSTLAHPAQSPRPPKSGQKVDFGIYETKCFISAQ